MGKATVHCNIIGFDRHNGPARLFEYESASSAPQETQVAAINGYLVDGPDVLVRPRRTPLSPHIAPVTFGNMPRDGGHLIVEADAYDEVMSDPVAAKYVRPFPGSEELVRGTQRWCLWLTAMDPADVQQSRVLRDRIEGVRQMRLASKASSTRAMATTPHLFGQRAAEMFDSYLAIPAVVSESRPYYTAARLPANVIASNKLYVAPDRDGFQFSVISSSMFLTWQLTVGNRLESRPSFSNTLVWNNFPLPDVNDQQRNAVTGAGQSVVEARALYPSHSLAQLYRADSMPTELTTAHNALDNVLDAIFGLDHADQNLEGRQRALFTEFARLDAGQIGNLR
ncbi:type IIL restriction-modification enzyme MmeI [Ornithinimicrobium sp. INDO-MA30-4]|uniref:type IIL restriction-modification enzyme MmeI n=1 Tax=Ornithinimicrobium sp. INDO-MA30-4 TaxID=2908651 RepID=UPI002883199D|nr:type IIL restriction-modification enzyme MmeI [Ornithinimicrobium sp. INDO-MA30-4]